jgi:hypothetical protein
MSGKAFCSRKGSKNVVGLSFATRVATKVSEDQFNLVPSSSGWALSLTFTGTGIMHISNSFQAQGWTAWTSLAGNEKKQIPR